MRSILDRRELGPEAARARPELRRILCTFDLSEASRQALGCALMLARRHGVQAQVMHVLPSAAGSPRAVAEATAALERACPAATDRLVRVGDPVQTILDRAAEWRADLVVMGTHGQSRPRPWGLGSTTEAVVRRARSPVLAVPCRTLEASAGPAPFHRVLAAFDFSEPAQHMLDHVACLGNTSQLELTLLHVLEWFPDDAAGAAAAFSVPEYQLDLAQVTRERVLRAVQASALAGRPHRAEVAAGVPYREILRVAGEQRADLIALGQHGRRALDRWLPGSTISHLLRESPCPVLAVNL
jgi:nucleotide-binding universal stress UspA family protein